MERPCKEWMGARTAKGYGVRRYNGKTWRAHRAAWDAAVSPIPDGMMVLHHCDNPPCYEITHLYLGTPSDNSRDMTTRDRQARRGHLPQSKLSTEAVAVIRRRYAGGDITQAELAREYGVTQGAISSILRDRRRTGKPRLTPAVVDEIRRRHAAGATQRELAVQFGINQSSVSEIVRRKSHT